MSEREAVVERPWLHSDSCPGEVEGAHQKSPPGSAAVLFAGERGGALQWLGPPLDTQPAGTVGWDLVLKC